jgi:hypothetical protein
VANKKRIRYATAVMARRPRVEERILSAEDLKQLQENLARLSESGVRELYLRAHRECALIGGHFPDPVSIQQLVQAWKQLRKWRR